MLDGPGASTWHFRAWQVSAALATLLACAWSISLGALPGLCGLLIAKHVLVAILAMGLGVDAPGEE